MADNSLDSLFKSSVNNYVSTNVTLGFEATFSVTETSAGSKEYTIGNSNGEVKLTKSGDIYTFTSTNPTSTVTLDKSDVSKLLVNFMTIRMDITVAAELAADGVILEGSGVVNIENAQSAIAIDIGTHTFTAGSSNASGSDDGVSFTLAGQVISIPNSGVANKSAAQNAATYVTAINAAGLQVVAQDNSDGTFNIVNATSDIVSLITIGSDIGQTGFKTSSTISGVDISNMQTDIVTLEVKGGTDTEPFFIEPNFKNANGTDGGPDLGVNIVVADNSFVTVKSSTTFTPQDISIGLGANSKFKMNETQFTNVKQVTGEGKIELTDTTFSFTDTESADNITTNGTITFNLASNTQSWQYFDGTAWQNDGALQEGYGSFTLPNGEYSTVEIKQTNSHGVSVYSSMPVDTTLQVVAPVTDITLTVEDTADESRSDGTTSDGITSNGEVSFTLSEGAVSWRYMTNGTTYSNLITTTGKDVSFTLNPDTYTTSNIKVLQIAADGSSIVSYFPSTHEQWIVQDAPDQIVFSLDNDTGRDVADGVSNDGTITPTLASDTTSWQYSIERDADELPIWIEGDTSFELKDEGSYATASIQVKQFNASGLSSISSLYLSDSEFVVIDKTAPTIPTIEAVTTSGYSDGDFYGDFEFSGDADDEDNRLTLSLEDALNLEDELSLTVTPVDITNFIVGSTVAGDTVATTTTSSDETIVYIIDDIVNYEIDSNGKVTLTEAGAEVVNEYGTLPDFDLTAATISASHTSTLTVDISDPNPQIIGNYYQSGYIYPDEVGAWDISLQASTISIVDGVYTLNVINENITGNTSNTSTTLGIYTKETDATSFADLDTVDNFIISNDAILTLTATQANGSVISGGGGVTINGSDGAQTVKVTSEYDNSITLGLDGDSLTLGDGFDNVIISHDISGMASDSSIGSGGNLSNIDTITNFNIVSDTLSLSTEAMYTDYITYNYIEDPSYDETDITIYNGIVTNYNTDAISKEQLVSNLLDILVTPDYGGYDGDGYGDLTVAGFQYGDDYYLVAGDTQSGISDGDIVVKLVGVSGIESLSSFVSIDYNFMLGNGEIDINA